MAFLGLFAVLLVAVVGWEYLKRHLRWREGCRKDAVMFYRQSRVLYAGEHEFRAVSEVDFPGKDLSGYRRVGDFLLENGFRHLGSLENLTLTSVFPQWRTFFDAYVGPEGGYTAATYRVEDLQQALGFSTVLADGRILTTSTVSPGPWDLPPSVSWQALPSDTSPAEVLSQHRQRHAVLCAVEPGVDVVTAATLEDAIAISRRISRVHSDHRRSLGGKTEQEFLSFTQNPREARTARMIWKEFKRISDRGGQIGDSVAIRFLKLAGMCLGVSLALGGILGTYWILFVPSPPRDWESVTPSPTSPEPLLASLDRIGAWLEDNHLPAARSLRPGLEPAEIRSRLRFVPGHVPRELVTLYQWHDGQDASFEGLIPDFAFLPLSEAVAERRRLLIQPLALGPWGALAVLRGAGWDRRWLPVLTLQNDLWVAVVSTRPSETAVFFEDYLEEPEPVSVRPSIADFMAEVAECFDTGAFFVSDEGDFTEDPAAVDAIRRRHDPAIPTLEHWPESLQAVIRQSSRGGRIETRVAPNGLRFETRFDERGRLVEETEADGGVRVRRRTTNTYDESDRIRERRRESGGVTQTITWTYGTEGSTTILDRLNGGWRQTDAVRKRDGRLKVRSVTKGHLDTERQPRTSTPL